MRICGSGGNLAKGNWGKGRVMRVLRLKSWRVDCCLGDGCVMNSGRWVEFAKEELALCLFLPRKRYPTLL